MSRSATLLWACPRQYRRIPWRCETCGSKSYSTVGFGVSVFRCYRNRSSGRDQSVLTEAKHGKSFRLLERFALLPVPQNVTHRRYVTVNFAALLNVVPARLVTLHENLLPLSAGVT